MIDRAPGRPTGWLSLETQPVEAQREVGDTPWEGVPPNGDQFGWHWLLFPLMDPVVGRWHPQRGVAPGGHWTFVCGFRWEPHCQQRICQHLAQIPLPDIHANIAQEPTHAAP